jgi:thioredoxin 1
MASNNVLTITIDNFETEVVNSPIPVLIDFWAVWCGPCRMIAPTVEILAEELKGKIKVGKVNVDEQPELAAKYGIMSIPTVSLIKGKKIIMNSIGAKSKDMLKREIEARL